MRSLRKRIGIFLFAGIAMTGVIPTALAGPQESPGVSTESPQPSAGSVGPQESPGVILDATTALVTEIIVPGLTRFIP